MIDELSFVGISILIVAVGVVVVAYVLSLDKRQADAVLGFIACVFLIFGVVVCVVEVMPECKNKVYFYCPEYVW